jgi:hypothetical protein
VAARLEWGGRGNFKWREWRGSGLTFGLELFLSTFTKKSTKTFC